MNATTDNLGIIAGSRALPLDLARLARAAGVRRIVAVAFRGETEPGLADLVDDIVWIKVGQLVKMIDAFRERHITRCVMAGQISPKNLFDLRPDFRALSILVRLKERNARTIFAAIADELHRDGVELVDARPWLKPILPEVGYSLGPALTDQQRQDVDFGYRIAKEMSRLDIGQTVVVKNGTVLAVEAFEGTDDCLHRGGALAGKEGKAVAIKVASASHDFRFDIPCMGPQTVAVCAAARIAVVAFEAGKTLLLDKAEFERDVARAKIALTAAGESTSAPGPV